MRGHHFRVGPQLSADGSALGSQARLRVSSHRERDPACRRTAVSPVPLESKAESSNRQLVVLQVRTRDLLETLGPSCTYILRNRARNGKEPIGDHLRAFVN